MTINILPDHVINQISAGEVVERPSSIVRELLDNSLDAGASDITVTLVEGGQSLIVVSDNGIGMTPEDAQLAFKRHATSKLKTSEDIDKITTFGFRGEALPSIAAVARVKLKTKTTDSQLGVEIRYAGGELQDVKPVPARVGTVIEVANLFFNTPARKKFLKSSRGEELRIKNLIKHTSIANPEVKFRLFAEERELLNMPATTSMTERASTLFKGAYIPFRETVNGQTVSGLIGHPSQAGLKRNALTIFVNGRLVSDAMILRAVRDGFESTIKSREFPSGFVSIEIPAELVDVNVHPQKSEVRFRNPQDIYLNVRRAIRKTVQEFISPVDQTGSSKDNFSVDRDKSLGEYSASPFSANNAWTKTQGSKPEGSFLAAHEPLPDSAARSEVPGWAAASEPAFRFSELKYLAQALNCYLLCERNERLVVVDMHAAHERVNYNLIRHAYKNKSAASQQLLTPISFESSEEGVLKFMEYQALLERFGFEIEPFGDETLLIRALPTIIREKDTEKFLQEFLLMEFSESAEEVLEQLIDSVAARIACHSSVRSGQVVNREQVYSLFESLDRTEFSAACPHGRPVVVSFSLFEIERWFGRV